MINAQMNTLAVRPYQATRTLNTNQKSSQISFRGEDEKATPAQVRTVWALIALYAAMIAAGTLDSCNRTKLSKPQTPIEQPFEKK